MVIYHHKLFHYVLIVLLMLAPVRGASAMQESQCNMDMAAAMIDEAMNHEGMNHEGMNHEAMNHEDMDHKSVADDSISKQTTENLINAATHQCCCCDGGGDCAMGCEMAMPVSLVLQASLFTPVYIAVTQSTKVSSTLLLRAPTPPSRPPAHIS